MMFGIYDAIRNDLRRNALRRAIDTANRELIDFRERIIDEHDITSFAYAAIESATKDQYHSFYLRGYNWKEHRNDGFVGQLLISKLLRRQGEYNDPQRRNRMYLTLQGEVIWDCNFKLQNRLEIARHKLEEFEFETRSVGQRFSSRWAQWKQAWAERKRLPDLSELLTAFKGNLEAAERIQQIPSYVKPEDIELIPLRNTWTLEQQREMNDLYWESNGLAFWLNPAGVLADTTPAPEWWVRPVRQVLHNPQPVEDIVSLSLQPPEGYVPPLDPNTPYGFIPASPEEIAEKYREKEAEYNNGGAIDEILEALDLMKTDAKRGKVSASEQKAKQRAQCIRQVELMKMESERRIAESMRHNGW
jgi:hypothetical protein